MKLFIQIISWAMLAIGAIASIDLLVQMDKGAQGDVPGLVLGIAWIIQSISILIYLHQNNNSNR